MSNRELRFQDQKTKTYLGSPSIVRLPDRALLATHDYFGPGSPRNYESEEHLTSVYRSDDNGESWQSVTHIANAYWSTLFVHKGDVWLLGATQQYGSIVIRKSSDGGFTWTHPADAKTGLLFKGGFFHANPNYHCAPVPVLSANGRLFKGFEDCVDCAWGTGFQALAVSAPEDSDLLDASSWTMSDKVAFDPKWLPDWGVKLGCPGWLEGNIVQGPDGQLYDILRFNADPLSDKAAVLELSADGKTLKANPSKLFIDMPGGCHKFSIRLDPKTGVYLTLSNNNTAKAFPWQRNVLSLCSSKDLRNWNILANILTDGDATETEESLKFTGFQYVDWQFDGEDIIALVRTSRDGAHNFHDSNRIIFHRIESYSKYLKR